MRWESITWNYHKLGLVIALFVFILLIPPVYTFLQKSTVNGYWSAFVVALLVWSFVFIMLHIYTGRRNQQDNDASVLT
jgi:hypothetical protein